jgi:hypothetical protein
MVTREREVVLNEERIVTFQPAAVGTAETTGILTVKKGDRIISVDARKTRLAAGSTTSTISIGDGGDVDRFIAVTDTETGSVEDYINPVSGVLPYTYNANDTIDANYIIGGTPGATNPQWVVRITWIPLGAQQTILPSFKRIGG